MRGQEQGKVWLYRQIQSSAIWDCDPSVIKVFIACVLNANWKEARMYDRATGKERVIPRGSFVTTLQKFSQECRVSMRQMRTALSTMENLKITTRTTTRRTTQINVLNYDTFQKPATQPKTQPETHERHTSDTMLRSKELKTTSKPLSRNTAVKHPDRAHANSEEKRLGLAPEFNNAEPPPENGDGALANDPHEEMRLFILANLPDGCRPDIDVGIVTMLLDARATFELKAAWAIFVRPGEKSYAWAKSRNFSTFEFMRQIPTLVGHDDYPTLKRRYRDAETIGGIRDLAQGAVIR